LCCHREGIVDKKKILKEIREIEVSSNILANEVFAGEYHSFFKGNGMEFSDIRRYSMGDDVKKIDWKVSARQRKTYVKEFVEERELSMYILVDVSASNSFPKQKLLVAKLLGSLAFSANKNNDRVGALLFTDRVEEFIPLKKGRKHSLSILEKYLLHRCESRRTDIREVLNFFYKVVKRKSIVFLISDFMDEGYEKTMRLVGKKHDLIPIRISNSKRARLPKGALFSLVDSETGEELLIENLKKDINIEESDIRGGLTIDVEGDYVRELSRFFKMRR